MWHMDGGWGWWMLVGMVAMAGFWIAIIWAVVAIVRRWPNQSEERHARQKPASLEILERRYASGELTNDEFEAMKRRLIE